MDFPLALSDLHKSYGSQTVLDGLTLDVREGETVAVLGQSGGGKSVLLKLIVGLQKPDSGLVRIHGKDLAGLTTTELNEVRKTIGFLFQQSALYDSMTVEDNVAFPLRRHTDLSGEDTRRKALELLKSVGMDADDSKKMPSEISGGMQKRVGLARALALDPDVLLFDEPTAGLDPVTASEIAALIAQLKDRHKKKGHKITGVVVTHDLRGAKIFADRFVLLREGRVLLEGSLDDLRQSKDAFVKKFMEDD